MRIGITMLFGGCVACSAHTAWGQTPGEVPSAVPGASTPSVPPSPPASPPTLAQPPPALAQPPTAPPPPPPAPPAAFPQEPAPLKLSGRVGFGLGLWANPVSGLVQSSGISAVGTPGPVSATYGGQAGIRGWVSERVVLVPLLRMNISHTSAPDSTTDFGPQIAGAEFTTGLFAASLSLGYAAYRGNSTRFIVLGGLGFGYSVQQTPVPTQSTGNGAISYRYESVKAVGFTVPVGFALEQFFTPRISVVASAESPLFSYSSVTVGTQEPRTTIGADFESTRLSGSVFFYTD